MSKFKTQALKKLRINVPLIKRIPRSRFFSTIYPKVITLSPGTSFNLPITFKPLDTCIYEDAVQFHIHETQHSFHVTLNGLIPSLSIDLPSNIDLGFCTTFETASQQFKLQNLSELDTIFEFDVKEPFSIIPSSGTLRPKSSIFITCSINPDVSYLREFFRLRYCQIN